MTIEAQDKGEKVSLGVNPSGAVIGVGLPLKGALFVQELWLKGVPHYAFINTSDVALQVSIRAWNRALGPCLAGPWELAPQAISLRAVEELVVSYPGPLLAVVHDETSIFGLLKAPYSLPDYIDWSACDGIATVQGLNGVGDRDAGVVFLQPTLSFTVAQHATLEVFMPRNLGKLSFAEPPTAALPAATVVRIFSAPGADEIQHEPMPTEQQAALKQAPERLTVEVRLPSSTANTMAVVSGRISGGGGSSFALLRGLIVSPERT